MKSTAKENFKTAIIVVLFLTTILLLYLLWRGDSPAQLSLSDILPFSGQSQDIPAAESFIVPEKVIFSEAGDSYIIKNDPKGEIISEVAIRLTEDCSGTASAGEIEASSYAQAIASYDSVQLIFGYSLPFSDFFSLYGNIQGPVFDYIDSFDAIAFSSAAPESYLIKSGDTYYRIACQSMNNFAGSLRAHLNGDEAVFYPAAQIIGVDNEALVPLSIMSNMSFVPYTAEASKIGDDGRVRLAESLFGENFEFVRRITDSFGNITYMYGYGQKALSCQADGLFEYSAEPVEGADPGFMESLNTAIRFITTHGGWLNAGEDMSYVLADASETGSGRTKLYKFSFAQTLGGVPVQDEDSYGLEIEITGGEVTHFRRNLVAADMIPADKAEAIDAANVLARNCGLIYNVLNHSVSSNSDEALSFSAQMLEEVSIGYIRTTEGLNPAWIMTMTGGRTFYFGLYDARSLGFTD